MNLQLSIEIASSVRRWNPYPAYKDTGVGWLAKIPIDWQMLRFKQVARLMYGDSLPASGREGEEVPVYGSNGIVGCHSEANTLAPALIIGRKGSYGKVNYTESICYAIDTTYYIDRRTTEVDLRWLYYVMLVLALDAYSEDSAIPGLSRDYVYSRSLPVPKIALQRTIAVFLDRETGKIDALVAKKERLIELLREKRAALITRAVTKGVSPNVPMKDSGVEWLGEIPVHWKVKRIKHLAKILRGKFSHRPRNDPILYDGPFPFIQTGDVAAANKYIREYQQTLYEAGYAVSKEFPNGTLVMAIAANIGDLAILGFRACFPDSIVGFVPEPGVKLEYLFYNLTAMRPEMLGAATLNTQMNLNIDRIGSLFTIQPPEVDQEAIVKLIDRETADIDALIAKIREGIEKLKEYRTALISAAVNGKIDVRENVVA